jgi:peptidoglycan-N-acetylglucosamine deacetylase
VLLAAGLGLVHAAEGRASAEEGGAARAEGGGPLRAAVVRSSQREGDRRVAVTFDDGPTPKQTRRVLAILKRAGVRATFFVLGQQVRRSPQLLKEIVEEGHLVAIHSWDHPKRASREEWRRQIRRTEEAIAAALGAGGGAASHYYRPPHGTVTPEVREVCGELGYTIVLYTLLSSDWLRPGVEELRRQVVGKLAGGGIVVLHDGGGDRRQTIEALPSILEGLRAKGLEPVRLDELLGVAPGKPGGGPR